MESMFDFVLSNNIHLALQDVVFLPQFRNQTFHICHTDITKLSSESLLVLWVTLPGRSSLDIGEQVEQYSICYSGRSCRNTTYTRLKSIR
jgi:hypothetical protein